MRTAVVLTVVFSFSIMSATCQNRALHKTDDPRLADIRLPEGFQISIFADSVPNARSLALGANGTVFVGSRNEGVVYALKDEDQDGRADRTYVLAENMNSPNGVAFRNGSLYVAEIDKIWRFDLIENNLSDPPRPILVYDKLPSDKHHGWKYIAFGPDDKLYIPIGAPCNICLEDDRRYSSITRINPDGTGFEVFAEGIRNTVGFDWHPETNTLWFTENGRDMMGNDIPPDELNHAPRAGMHFGFPFCHGLSIKDPEYGEQRNCNEFTKPEALLGPHVAALGMKFYRGSMFPSQYKHQIFIAEHGSWNRDEPLGYRVMLVTKNDNEYRYEPFAEGWLKNGKAWGRPVDILEMPDGSLLVSDDFADVVYRITYK